MQAIVAKARTMPPMTMTITTATTMAIRQTRSLLDADSSGADPGDTNSADATSGVVGNAGIAPGDTVAAKAWLNVAFRALNEQEKDASGQATNSLTKLGINVNLVAKAG